MPAPKNTIERVLRHRVDQSRGKSACWLWKGTLERGGYGSVHADGRRWQAHRYVYTHMKGPIPVGYVIDHTCNVTACVQPQHLEAVTYAENTRRMVARGRGSKVRGKRREDIKSDAEFWARLTPSVGHLDCLEWPGRVDKGGYGRFARYGQRTAHRVAYFIEHGSIPSGKLVLHSCDNPPCCNPQHLYLGDAKDNSRDRTERMRAPRHRITIEQIEEIIFSERTPKEEAARIGESAFLIRHVRQPGGKYWRRLEEHRGRKIEVPDRLRERQLLRDDDFLLIYYSDEPTKALMEQFSVSKGTVISIRRMTQEAHVKRLRRLGVEPEVRPDKRRKITDEEFVAIFCAEGTHAEVARQFAVNRSYVSMIKGAHPDVRPRFIALIGEEAIPHTERKIRHQDLSDEALLDIHSSTETVMASARKHGITRNLAFSIRRGTQPAIVERLTRLLGHAPLFRHRRNGKFTDEEMREAYLSAEPAEVLADRYGVTVRYMKAVRSATDRPIRARLRRLGLIEE